MTVLDRFLKYVSYETTALEEKDNACSNEKMLLLANHMLEELQALEPDEISINRFGIIDAKFYGNGEKPMVAFLAHMDTSNQASGKDIKPRVVDYKGGDIELHPGMMLSPKDFPTMNDSIGHQLIVTDGNTLLGGDDKAGMAIIMQALEELKADKANYRPLEIIFTTDEEIGADAEHVSMEICKAKYGYTIDGEDPVYLSTETFSAYSMHIDVTGKSIHPGFAKDKLVNASNVLMRFHAALPEFLRPEETDGREPFYHLCNMQGSEDSASADYIIRSFDERQVEEMKKLAELTIRRINDHLGYEAIKCEIKEQYHNMKVVLDEHPEILEEIEGVYKNLGMKYQYESIRGGTTGSQLSFKGLPCPNLGTGDRNCHGKYEYVDLDEMKAMVKVVYKLMLA
jgi:tripeptide aminopeptidase